MICASPIYRNGGRACRDTSRGGVWYGSGAARAWCRPRDTSARFRSARKRGEYRIARRFSRAPAGLAGVLPRLVVTALQETDEPVGSSYQQFRDADVALLMISVDSPKRAAQLAVETGAPFPVLSDVDDDVTVAYNLFANGIALPATVLIDTAGRVRWVYVGQNPADRPSPDLMLDQVRHVGER